MPKKSWKLMQVVHCEAPQCCRNTTQIPESCADYGFDLQKLSQNIFTKQKCSGAVSMEVVFHHPAKEMTGNSVKKKWEEWNFGNHHHITTKVMHRFLRKIILPRVPLAANTKYIFRSYLLLYSCFRNTLCWAGKSVLLDFSFSLDLHHTKK